MKTNGGFTLIELLIVLTIIGILVALSINGFCYVSELQSRDRAKIEIKALKTALIEYRSKYDGYPICPKKICTPGECLFLRWRDFITKEGLWKFRPTPLGSTNLFGYDPSSYDAANSRLFPQ